MLRRLKALSSATILLLIVSTDASGQRVAVHASAYGQAILRESTGQCYAITPRHVVEGSIRPIELSDALGRRTTAVAYDAVDSVAIITLRNERDGLRCARAYTDRRDIDTWLRRGRPAFLSYGQPDSRVESNMEVIIADWNAFKIFVRARDASDQILQGMSGSPLVDEDGRLVGILLNVVDDGGQGRGEVLRADHLSRVTAGFFHRARPVVVQTTSFVTVAGDLHTSRNGTRGASLQIGQGLSRDLALVGGLQFATTDNGRLQNAVQNDTASVWSATATLSTRVWLFHGQGGFASYLQAGGLGQFESKAAYDSIFGEYLNTGLTASVGAGAVLSRYMVSLEVEGQLLWVRPHREREITTVARKREAVIVRLGISRFSGIAR